MKVLKAFIKFEAPQRSVKIQIQVIFSLIQLSEMHGVVRVNVSVLLMNFLMSQAVTYRKL